MLSRAAAPTAAPRRLFVGFVLLAVALVATGSFLYIGMGRDKRAIRRAFAHFEVAQRGGDATALLAATGPRSRDWMGKLLEAARTESRSSVQSRSVLEMSIIMDLRTGFSHDQLAAMSPDDAVVHHFKRDPSAPARPMQISRIRRTGAVATARLELVTGPTRRAFIGESEFFTLADGRWYYEPYLEEVSSMSRAESTLTRQQVLQVIQESVAKDTGRPFDDRLWNGPLP